MAMVEDSLLDCKTVMAPPSSLDFAVWHSQFREEIVFSGNDLIKLALEMTKFFWQLRFTMGKRFNEWDVLHCCLL